MVVALGTTDRQTEECLARVLGHVFGDLVQGVKVGRAVLVAAAGRRQDFANELVPRFVLADRIVNPLVIGLHRDRAAVACR